MGTSTNKITEKLRRQAKEEIKPFLKQMIIEGKDKNDCVQAYKNHLQAKGNAYYDRICQPQQVGPIAIRVIGQTKIGSKAELVFYDLLRENEISFYYQYPIGRYRVDFLLIPNLVIELDGPTHRATETRDQIRDKYIEKMGYRILRLPLDVVMLDPEAVMNEIRALLGV